MNPGSALPIETDSRAATNPNPAVSVPSLPSSPYKGLNPYTAADTAFFFGRTSETKIISANLIAERLTLLYGPSGVGKSSVLQAGVVHALQERARQELAETGAAEYIVIYFNNWRGNIVPALLQTAAEAIQSLRPVQLSPAATLTETLRSWSKQTGAELLFILDQFEEYFLYPENPADTASFALEFPRALKDPDLRSDFLLAFREDALAQLDRFEGEIPHLFRNSVRLKHLDLRAARQAVVEPIEQFNRWRPSGVPLMQIEPALVDAVLEQVRVGRVVLGENGRGGVPEAAPEDAIETPYLQLVMTRLWQEERQGGSVVLRLATLERLQGAERIVRTHLDATMAGLPPREQLVAARAFRYLVTPSGTKISYTPSDLATYSEIPEKQLEPVLIKLAGSSTRILRSVTSPTGQDQTPRFEIFHDVLGPAILDWRQRYLQRVRERRLRIGLFALGALVLLVLAGAFYLYITPSRLPAGSYNVAVAEFGLRDDQGQVRSWAEGSTLRKYIASVMKNNSQLLPDQNITTKEIGPVSDDADAARVAEELGADVVIYGNLETRLGAPAIVPRFYVRSTPEIAELVGPTRLGAPIPWISPLNSAYLSKALVPRLHLLVLFHRGSMLMKIGAYANAASYFQKALDDKDFASLALQDVVYTYLGAADIAQNKLPEAKDAFTRALAINPEYAPARVGLGQLFFLAQDLNNAQLLYEQAGLAKDKPPTAFVDAKIHLGLGKIYSFKTLSRIAELQVPAENEFQQVVLEYTAQKDDALRPLAAEAYYGLGTLKERLSNDLPFAARYYEQCVATASSVIDTSETQVRARCQEALDRLRRQSIP